MLKKFVYKALSKLTTKKNYQNDNYPPWLAYEPHLIPPLSLMGTEGQPVIEEWFRWAEEWSLLLRIYGAITKKSRVLEIGCGLGRTAFPLRYILLEGAYDGFEICKYKIDFLQNTFHKAYSNFNFVWANIHNTHYNPKGDINASNYKFPYIDSSFDIVYAASVFTHMLPDIAENYFKETARVLKPNGRVVFSFFILDFYQPGQQRLLGFARSGFNFDYPYEAFGSEFKIANPSDPEEMTAYKKSLIEKYAAASGLELLQEPIPGFWSNSTASWVGAQDIVVLKKL